jgi:hypothetical protein
VQDGYIDYDILEGAHGASDGVLDEAIYTFEAAAGVVDPADWKRNTCLVIGGYYKGNSEPTYYRVEFARETTPGDPATYEHLPLLRNYLYKVEVKEVSAHGWPDEGTAYENKPSNIKVTITEWNDGGLNDITFNDQHYLAVDKSSLHFYKEGHEKTIRVQTDFLPAGWTIEHEPGWITIDPVAYAGDDVKTVKVTATSLGDGATREPDFFYIVAGNLKKRIDVTQENTGEFSLEVDPGKLVFYRKPLVPREVSVIHYPTSLVPSFTNSTTIADADWTALGTLAAPFYAFQPNENTTGATRGGPVLVTISGSGGQLAKVIDVVQYARDPFFEAIAASLYPAMAGDYTLTVQSEIPWQLHDTDGPGNSDPDEFMTLPAPSLLPASPHVPVTYTFHLDAFPGDYNDPAREARILVTTDHELGAGKNEILIRQGGAPYINITDPASKLHVFGTDAPVTVTFVTNATWKFAPVVPADYDAIVDVTDVPDDTDQAGGTSPANLVTRSVEFTPLPVPGEPTIPSVVLSNPVAIGGTVSGFKCCCQPAPK